MIKYSVEMQVEARLRFQGFAAPPLRVEQVLDNRRLAGSLRAQTLSRFAQRQRLAARLLREGERR